MVRDRRHLFHDQIIAARAKRDRWAALVHASGLPAADADAAIEYEAFGARTAGDPARVEGTDVDPVVLLQR